MITISEVLKDDAVRSALADHYRRAIKAAEEGYEDSAADEDAVTGALGQAMRGTGQIRFGEQTLRWKTRYRKLRGRGIGAEEKKLGADGIFEVEFEDERGVRSRKSLPFQAKNDASTFGGAKLRDQAKKLTGFPGGGIVVNYGPNGYKAIDAEVIASGSVDQAKERSLSDILGGDFLECSRGSTAYLFEPAARGILLMHGTMLLVHGWRPRHRIRTSLSIAPKPL